MTSRDSETHDPRAVPWYCWLLAPFISIGIMLLIILAVITVVYPFWMMALGS